MKTCNQMTDAEITIRMRELMDILDCPIIDDEWDKAYSEYNKLRAVQDERYREKNLAAFNAFYVDHIEGKSWEEIDPEDWGFYSDWHKDMYGYRPKSI